MTRRDLTLHLLREASASGVTTADFLRAGVGSRYGARLRELREAGHTITAKRERDGSWRYTLNPERDIAPAPTPALSGSAGTAHPAAASGVALAGETGRLFEQPAQGEAH